MESNISLNSVEDIIQDFLAFYLAWSEQLILKIHHFALILFIQYRFLFHFLIPNLLYIP